MIYLKKCHALIFFTLLTVSLPIYSTVYINGICSDFGKTKSGVLIKVITNNGEFETMSNFSGGFSITAEKGDVIMITYDTFKKHIWISHDEIKMFINVDLSKNSVGLKYLNNNPNLNNPMLFEGIIFNEDGPISGYSIKNQAKQTITVTNFDGFFSCKIKPIDQLLFSSKEGILNYTPLNYNDYSKALVYIENPIFSDDESPKEKKNTGKSIVVEPISLIKQNQPKPIKHNRLKASIISIPGGFFQNNCKSQNRLKVAQSIFIKQFHLMDKEVSNIQFCNFLNDVKASENGFLNGHLLLNIRSKKSNILHNDEDNTFNVVPGFEHHPVVLVTWIGAGYFAEWCGGRLPTYTEWQFALFSSRIMDSNILDKEWLKKNADKTLHKTGEAKPYKNGLYDLIGNAKEWCWDGIGDFQSSIHHPVININPYYNVIDNSHAIAGLSYKDKFPKCYFSLYNSLPYNAYGPEISFRVAFNSLLHY